MSGSYTLGRGRVRPALRLWGKAKALGREIQGLNDTAQVTWYLSTLPYLRCCPSRGKGSLNIFSLSQIAPTSPSNIYEQKLSYSRSNCITVLCTYALTRKEILRGNPWSCRPELVVRGHDATPHPDRMPSMAIFPSLASHSLAP